jgi:hypothetical protein
MGILKRCDLAGTTGIPERKTRLNLEMIDGQRRSPGRGNRYRDSLLTTSMRAARPTSRRAIGTRNGEQET